MLGDYILISDFALFLFWCLIGYIILLPFLFSKAVLENIKISNVYDYYGRARIYRRRNKRDMFFYGLSSLTLTTLLLII